MRVRALIPDEKRLRIDEVVHGDSTGHVMLRVSSIAKTSVCPSCSHESARVHSRYQRTLSDLPWQGFQVRVVWATRRFFCDYDLCSQKIFAERQPTIAAAYSRRTERHSLALRCIAIACGGQAGACLAERLGMQTSPDTLLRLARSTAIPNACNPRVVGVDDWAFCKGRRYGTLICDLEGGRALDLLPDRDADSIAGWLRQFTSIKFVSRDRGDIYRKGANAGAPEAIQIADRFHLLKNLREAFARFLEGQTQQIRSAVARVQLVVGDEPDQHDEPQNATTTNEQRRIVENRERRLAKYQEVLELHQQGRSARWIAKQLSIHRSTVQKYLEADTFPERATRNYGSSADAHRDFLWSRWQAGCFNISQLWKEIVDRGFTGSYSSVRRLVSRWKTSDSTSKQSKTPPKRTPSANQVSWLFFKSEAKLSDDEVAIKDAIRSAWQIARRFVVMIRQRKGEHLTRWVKRATGLQVPSSIRQFAEGLKNDWDAIVAGLTLPWNNGSAEGHINRLKLIKRQMFGRANFDLLRARFLATA